jgi:integrative and conjugative element protein (TIGR02256 family)
VSGRSGGLAFTIGESAQRLIVTHHVLSHFAKHQQSTDRSFEAGGQLFAHFAENEITIERATGPRPTDRRSRFSYVPDRRLEQEEIDAMHREGLHFIGDWHTHPEPTPTPSGSDVRSIRDAVAKSKHHLNGFLMIIVGTDVFPQGLHLSLHGSTERIVVTPEKK